MSQVYVGFVSKLVRSSLLIFLSICVGHPGLATCQSSYPGMSADPAQRRAVISIGTQPAAQEAPDSKSKQSSFILTEVEPLLLLLFGLLLFSIATSIKLKLSRVKRASSQPLEPLVSRRASGSETRS